MKVPVIEVKGTPRELGYQHGRQAQEAVRRSFQFYLGLWKHFGGMGREQALKDGQRFLPFIRNLDPNLIEEMKGLAEGAGMLFEEILALNCRYELSYALMSPIPQGLSEGCTSYALTPEATSDKTTLIGQNWDNKPGLYDSCIILKILQEKKPAVAIYGEAGIIGNKGFNSAGIGVGLNYMRCEKDAVQPGLPLWVKVRGLLNCASLVDCLKILMTFEGPNSINIIMAHRDGEAIDVECTPDDNLFLYPERGILTHSNHFLSPHLRVKDTGKIVIPDSVVRSHRARRLFEEKRGNLNGNAVQGVLKDHFGHPHSICRHADESLPSYERWESLTSMIMNLTQGEMHYTAGPPCSNPYEILRLEPTH